MCCDCTPFFVFLLFPSPSSPLLRPFSFQPVIPEPPQSTVSSTLSLYISFKYLSSQASRVEKGKRRLFLPTPRFVFKERRPCEISRGAICFQNRNICSVKIWSSSRFEGNQARTFPRIKRSRVVLFEAEAGKIKKKNRLGTLNGAKLPLGMNERLARLTGGAG